MIDVLLIVLVLALAGYALHLRDLIRVGGIRSDRLIASIERERAERGKLSRRIAQSETKISRLNHAYQQYGREPK